MEEKNIPHVLEGWINAMLQDHLETNEEKVLCHLMKIDLLDTILLLEARCPLLAAVMDEQHWWELLFVKWFPITYERLQHAPICANSKHFLSMAHSNHCVHLQQKHLSHYYRDIWIAQHAWTKFNALSVLANADVPESACIATALGDEFGIGPLFATRAPHVFIAQRIKNKVQWRQFHLHVPELHAADFSRYSAESNFTTKHFMATAIPLQGKVILRMFVMSVSGQEQEGYDLVMLNIRTDTHTKQPYIAQQDMSNWAINYPDGNPLDLPPFLDGDASLEVPSIAATEKNAHLSSMQCNGALSVLLDRVWPPPYDLLIFDQVYQSNNSKSNPPAHDTWHSLCTARVKAQCVVTSTAYVLDSFLLMASADGTLWARPRNNPRSQYWIAQFAAPLTFLTSLYNVIAFMCNQNATLHVCHVKRIPVDPFIALVHVFSTTSACPVLPLLFGPFILYQTTLMESSNDDEQRIATLSKRKANSEHEETEKPTNGEPEHNGNLDNVPPEVYKNGRNWQRNRQKMILRYGLWDIEKRQIQQQHEEAERVAERKAVQAKMRMMSCAEFVLVNYETNAHMRVHFPSLPYGWRLHSIKMANHSHWVLTLYNCNKLMDVILSPSW